MDNNWSGNGKKEMKLAGIYDTEKWQQQEQCHEKSRFRI